MNTIQIFGIGSPFGDDQLGWKVIEILSYNQCLQPYIPKQISFDALDRPGAGLLHHIRRDAIVFIIDAIKTGLEVATIHRYENPHINIPDKILSTHGLSIIHALQLGEVLDTLPNKIIFYGIEIEDIILHPILSDRIQRGVEALADMLANELLITLASKTL